MTLVLDASATVAALIDSGSHGIWARRQLLDDRLLAPHFMLVEAANILRRAALRGDVPENMATRAHAELQALNVELVAYQDYAARVWELRGNLTTYDAWYVALAEALDAPLATLDLKLTRSPGAQCRFVVPDQF